MVGESGISAWQRTGRLLHAFVTGADIVVVSGARHRAQQACSASWSALKIKTRGRRADAIALKTNELAHPRAQHP